MPTDDEIKAAITLGLRKCRVEGGAPVPLIREYDFHHITHMVFEEVKPLLAGIERVEALCAYWDTLTRTESPTTKQIREALNGEAAVEGAST